MSNTTAQTAQTISLMLACTHHYPKTQPQRHTKHLSSLDMTCSMALISLHHASRGLHQSSPGVVLPYIIPYYTTTFPHLIILHICLVILNLHTCAEPLQPSILLNGNYLNTGLHPHQDTNPSTSLETNLKTTSSTHSYTLRPMHSTLPPQSQLPTLKKLCFQK